MRIYLAATAPSNEKKRPQGMLEIPRRLLSYYFITEHHQDMDARAVFEAIQRLHEKEETDG